MKFSSVKTHFPKYYLVKIWFVFFGTTSSMPVLKGKVLWEPRGNKVNIPSNQRGTWLGSEMEPWKVNKVHCVKKSWFKLILLFQFENMLMVVSNWVKTFKSYIYFYILTVTFYKCAVGIRWWARQDSRKSILGNWTWNVLQSDNINNTQSLLSI